MIRAAATLRIAGPARHIDRGITALLWLIAGAVTGAFAWIVFDILRRGLAALDLAFLVRIPEDAGRAGGILPVVVSTAIVLVIALLIAVPAGTAVALFLAEYTRAESVWGRQVGRGLDLLAATPSILFGLFGNAFFCVALGMGYSLLAGGLTLACMILPLTVRASESALRAVPHEYRLAGAALAMGRTATIRSVLLPAALPGIVVGVVVATGRALAETAALLFTSGYVMRMPTSPLDSGRTLSIHIYDLAMHVPGGEARAGATALVLLALLMGIGAVAMALTARWQRRLAR